MGAAPERQVAVPKRLAYGIDEAATEVLGISRDSFDRHVLPEVRTVRVGRRRLVSVAELERFLERHGTLLFEV
jgi:hypothetical protein